METIAKRAKKPVLSSGGEHVLAQYERRLRVEENVCSATIRNYLSDLRQFMAWCESLWQQGREDGHLLKELKQRTNEYDTGQIRRITVGKS